METTTEVHKDGMTTLMPKIRTLQLACSWPSCYTVLLVIEKDSQVQTNNAFN